MIKYIIILLSLSVSFNAVACDDTRVSISLASYHMTTTYKPDNIASYNQLNLGAAYECGITDNIYIEAGIYNNSLYKTSIHAGILLHTNYKGYEVGTNIGIITGYRNNAVPYARPYIQYSNFRLGFIPKIKSLRTENTLTLEYAINL